MCRKLSLEIEKTQINHETLKRRHAGGGVGGCSMDINHLITKKYPAEPRPQLRPAARTHNLAATGHLDTEHWIHSAAVMLLTVTNHCGLHPYIKI